MANHQLITANVLFNEALTPDTFRMVLFAPDVAGSIKPGQFAMVYLNSGELLLPRPISICDADGQTITLLYQVVGAGTKAMSAINSGEGIKILLPLGKGFYLGSDAKTPLRKVALVGGGIGVAPLVLLGKALAATDAHIDIYLGFRDSAKLQHLFKGISENIHIATDTGAEGFKGNAVELLKSRQTDYDEILACGPTPMLNALATYGAEKGIPCQLSMEERMACGIGTCVGCVLEIEGTYTKICTEGPVFYSGK